MVLEGCTMGDTDIPIGRFYPVSNFVVEDCPLLARVETRINREYTGKART